MTTQLPKPTVPIDAQTFNGSVVYWLTRDEKERIDSDTKLTYVEDSMTARNIHELQRGKTYRFVGTSPDDVILEDTDTHERVLLFRETFLLALRNGYFHVH